MSTPPSCVVTCTAPGDLVSTSSKAYRDIIEPAMAAAANNPAWTVLELDLQAARFIDSVGINLIILLIRRMKDRGGKV